MLIEPDVPDLPEGVTSVNIKEQRVFDGLPFPLILSPADAFKDKDAQFWNDWVKTNLKVIESRLLKYGAILFRGFPLDTPKEFDEFAKAYGYKEFPLLGIPGFKFNVVGNVYTSTEAPPRLKLYFHHEMGSLKNYPLIQFFYCDIPAKEGGETPLALSNVIYRMMVEREPEFVDRLENHGVRYVRILPEKDDLSSPNGRSWLSTFFASDKEEAERKAKTLGYDIEWLEDGSMKAITQALPAIRLDKRTGKKMWFNGIFSYYRVCEDARMGTRRADYGRYDRNEDVFFGNGDTINAAMLEAVEQVCEEAAVSFKWLKKDVILVDNRIVQHARNSFVPPRRTLISLFEDHQGPLLKPEVSSGCIY